MSQGPCAIKRGSKSNLSWSGCALANAMRNLFLRLPATVGGTLGHVGFETPIHDSDVPHEPFAQATNQGPPPLERLGAGEAFFEFLQFFQETIVLMSVGAILRIAVLTHDELLRHEVNLRRRDEAPHQFLDGSIVGTAVERVLELGDQTELSLVLVM